MNVVEEMAIRPAAFPARASGLCLTPIRTRSRRAKPASRRRRRYDRHHGLARRSRTARRPAATACSARRRHYGRRRPQVHPRIEQHQLASDRTRRVQQPDDGLGHIFYEDKAYNGHDAKLIDYQSGGGKAGSEVEVTYLGDVGGEIKAKVAVPNTPLTCSAKKRRPKVLLPTISMIDPSGPRRMACGPWSPHAIARVALDALDRVHAVAHDHQFGGQRRDQST
ncbi:MAG: hypothetical protein HC794_02760 [Nitrospiraceae bacterium]|nr:hypothetical protein [Nitrospiraceae bacterium]